MNSQKQAQINYITKRRNLERKNYIKRAIIQMKKGEVPTQDFIQEGRTLWNNKDEMTKAVVSAINKVRV